MQRRASLQNIPLRKSRRWHGGWSTAAIIACPCFERCVVRRPSGIATFTGLPEFSSRGRGFPANRCFDRLHPAVQRKRSGSYPAPHTQHPSLPDDSIRDSMLSGTSCPYALLRPPGSPVVLTVRPSMAVFFLACLHDCNEHASHRIKQTVQVRHGKCEILAATRTIFLIRRHATKRPIGTARPMARFPGTIGNTDRSFPFSDCGFIFIDRRW